MSDGYNKPQYFVAKEKSTHEPAVGETFEDDGEIIRCVVTDNGCTGCVYNFDMRKTTDHRLSDSKKCVAHFCESETRSDGCNVKFIKEKQ